MIGFSTFFRPLPLILLFTAGGCSFAYSQELTAVQTVALTEATTPRDTTPQIPTDTAVKAAPPIDEPVITKRSWIDKLAHGIPIGNSRLLPMPTMGYSPETSLSLGFSVQSLFRFRGDSTTNLSQSGITFAYTLRNQFIVSPRWRLYIGKDKYRVSGDLVFKRYPDSFYGIGNDTREEDRQKYSANYFMFKNRFGVRVHKSILIGFQVRTEYMYNMKPLEQGIFFSEEIVGEDGYFAAGAGPVFEYDTRDNVLFPFTGTYITLSNYYYSRLIGSKVDFVNIAIDARQFFNPYKSHVIALQAIGEFNTGEPPFKMMAELGGSSIMRGNFKGRYRDRNYMAAQVEYRFPIFWRFIGVGFVGAGDVFHNFSDLHIKNLKLSYGGGLRVTLDAKERINMRFDAAFGLRGAHGFYFALTEAF